MLETTKLHILNKSNDQQQMDNLFVSLYDDYSGLLGFIASKYISNSDSIKGIINESFYKLFKERKNVNNIKYYLVTCAKNLAINECKKSINLANCSSLNNEDMYQTDESITSSLDYKIFIESLHEYLNDEEITIFLQHESEGKTFKEISKSMLKQESYIQSKYYRVIKKIKEKENKNEK